jgi:hypothetical protein
VTNEPHRLSFASMAGTPHTSSTRALDDCAQVHEKRIAGVGGRRHRSQRWIDFRAGETCGRDWEAASAMVWAQTVRRISGAPARPLRTAVRGSAKVVLLSQLHWRSIDGLRATCVTA